MNFDINRYFENLVDKMEKLVKLKEKVEIKRWYDGFDFFMKVVIICFDIVKGFLYIMFLFMRNVIFWKFFVSEDFLVLFRELMYVLRKIWILKVL